jgi:hypothetical protein
MFEVHLACSDCPEEIELLVGDLAELEGLGCECGYGFVSLAIGEVELEVARGKVIAFTRRDDDLPLAA